MGEGAVVGVLAVGALALLTIAFSASAATRLRIASPLVLVLLGIAVSVLPQMPDVVVDPEWVLVGVLPPLLYSAAVQVPAVDFRRDFRTITGLSVALVVVSAVALGFLFHALVPGLPLAAGIALGAIVSPTDAVATSIVRDVGVSPRITSILQGESLLNDATALALLRSAVAVTILTDVATTAGDVVGDFLRSVVIAVVVGAVVGRLNLRVRARVTDPTVNTVVTLAVPFVAALPVEALDASGLVAAVVAGLVTGHGAPRLLTPAHRASDAQIWRVIELVLEGSVFLLMGLELDAVLHQLGADRAVARGIGIAMLALGVILIVRALYVAVLVRSVNRRLRREPELRRWIDERERALAAGDALPPGTPSERLDRLRHRLRRKRHDLDYFVGAPLTWREGGVLTWAGMRGVVTLVAAQTLPASVPHRHLLVFVAFVVAAVSLLVQGGTLPWVVRLLRPAAPEPEALAAERAALGERLHGAVMRELEGLPTSEAPPPVVAQVLERMRSGEVPPAPALEAARRLRLQLIEAQRAELLRLRSTGAFSSQVLQERLDQLDAQQIALEARDPE